MKDRRKLRMPKWHAPNPPVTSPYLCLARRATLARRTGRLIYQRPPAYRAGLRAEYSPPISLNLRNLWTKSHESSCDSRHDRTPG